MKVLFITDVQPKKDSKEGRSGFTWTIYAYLKKQESVEIELKVYESRETQSVIQNQLSIFALKGGDIQAEWDKYDKVLIYPDSLLVSLPKYTLHKVIVLGPDATSMARWSKYRAYCVDTNAGKIKRIYQRMFAARFLALEKKYIPLVERYLVVGISDCRWLRKHLDKKYRDKVQFLPHPLVNNALVDFSSITLQSGQRKRFVFAGDMSYSYVGRNIQQLSDALRETIPKEVSPINILIVGGKNKWVYDIFQQNDRLNVTYIKWVEDYQSVCQIGRDVHCVPLIAGAGTKNRVLTALANGLEVITTRKGVENIPLAGLTHLYVTKNMHRFAKFIIAVSQSSNSADELEQLIHERTGFRDTINRLFRTAMKKLVVE